MAQETVLLLGNYRPCLTLARRLTPLGYKVIVTRGGGEGCSEFSRHVAECWDHPPLSDVDAFIEALGAFLRQRPDIQIVMPVWEACVEAIAAHGSRLPPDRVYATPRPKTVTTCLDKDRMNEIAVASQVPCAHSELVRTYDDLRARAKELAFPVVIRPKSSSVPLCGKKALILMTAQDLETWLPQWPDGHDELIVQDYVDGPRHNLYLAARNGTLIRLLAVEIVRTHLKDGTGLAVEGATYTPDATLKTYAEDMVRTLDYDGVGCLQVMVDERTGAASFLELNPRIAGNHAIAEACGLELSRLAIDLARGHGADEQLFVGPANKRFAWTYCEMRGIRKALADRDIGVGGALGWIGRAIRTGVTADIHITWSWSDPLPTLMLFAKQTPGVAALVPNRWKATQLNQPALPHQTSAAAAE